MIRELAHAALDLAAPLAAILLFALPGWALCECFPALRRRPLVRRAAFAYLLGVAAVGGLLFVLSHVAGVPLRPPAIWSAVAATALPGLAARLLRRRRLRRVPPSRTAGAGAPRPGGPRRLAAVVRFVCGACAVLICLGLLAEAAANPVHDWDGRMTWDTLARYMRAAASVDAPVLQGAQWFVTHPQYPPLLPLAQVAVLEVFHADPDSHLVRAPYAAFFPVLLLLIWDGARRSAGRTAAALAVLVTACIPFFALGEGGAYSTYSDLPLACFYGAALLLLLGPAPRLADAPAAGLLLAAAALTKNEGLPLAVAGLAIGGYRALGGPLWRARRPSAAFLRWSAAAALPLAVAGAVLFSWRAGIPNRYDEAYGALLLTGGLWPRVLTNVTIFGPVLLGQMLRIHHWADFWLLAAALLVAGRRVWQHPLLRRWAIAAAVPPAVAWAAYSISTDPGFIAAVTWERFLLQGSVATLILLAAAAAEVGRHFAARRRRPAGAPPQTKEAAREEPPPAETTY